MVIYLSGHGIQCADDLFFIPVDGQPTDVQRTCVSITEIVSSLRSRMRAGQLLVFADICRSTAQPPAPKRSSVLRPRQAQRWELTLVDRFWSMKISYSIRVTNPYLPSTSGRVNLVDVVIAFATAAGCQAFHTSGGRHSHFTGALLQVFAEVPLSTPLLDILRLVKEKVIQGTGGRQRPCIQHMHFGSDR